MNANDRRRFMEILTMMAELYDKGLTDAQARLWFKLLEHVDIGVFESAAMDYMRSDAAFMPKPGQLLTKIQERDGRPTPEEAWNMVSYDEAATNVWTAEMETAFWSAFDSGASGDRIAGRVAFLEVYRREVAKARADCAPTTWTVSLGHDVDGRAAAIRDAVDKGRLSIGRAQHYLPHMSAEEIKHGILPAPESVKKLLESEDAA